MNPVAFFTLLATVAALLGALLGVSLSRRAGQEGLNRLLLAASGVLLAVVTCDVLPDSKGALSWPVFLAATLGGWAAFGLFTRYVYPMCPSCAFSEFDSEKIAALRRTAALLLFALALHSALDGVAVAVGGQMSHHAGQDLLIAITLHKLPEGFALAALLLSAGYTPSKTLAWATLVESATLAGGIWGAWFLRGASPQFLALLLAPIGGGFLYLVTSTLRHAVLDKSLPISSRRGALFVVGGAFAATAGLLALLRVV